MITLSDYLLCGLGGEPFSNFPVDLDFLQPMPNEAQTATTTNIMTLVPSSSLHFLELEMQRQTSSRRGRNALERATRSSIHIINTDPLLQKQPILNRMKKPSLQVSIIDCRIVRTLKIYTTEEAAISSWWHRKSYTNKKAEYVPCEIVGCAAHRCHFIHRWLCLVTISRARVTLS
jgi:hypothetical protein